MANPTPTNWHLEANSEWVAHDPFGALKPADESATAPQGFEAGQVQLPAARNGYTSIRLSVTGQGAYRLSIDMDTPIEADLFRCWYHATPPPEVSPAPPEDSSASPEDSTAQSASDTSSTTYFTDALVPVAHPCAAQLPDPDNAIDGQTHQAYWLDLFVPADAPTGPRTGRVTLEAGDQRIELAVTLDILDAVIPDDNAITCDHNSYGCRWVENLYPTAWAACQTDQDRTDLTIEVLHDYYRLCHEHRGLFSNLGVGHAGTFDPIYGPTLKGHNRDKTLDDWTLFDQHYGPLLDGSAFATPGTGAPRPRRPAKPIESVYTPINTSWPADYLYWGQPGYEAEFVRGVGQFDQHFRDKGWLTTRVAFFFNHKKRYRWYAWDGDEPKHAKDISFMLEMGHLLEKTVGGSPVPWCYRMDASWQMKNQFDQLAGMIGLWVCASFIEWYPQETRQVLDRGEDIWTYSGTPEINQTSAALLEHVLKAWARGINGHCEWLTCQPGPDPWFACDGAATGMLYPGDRFGLTGPIPSARLKIQRNAIQDISLINAATPDDALDQQRTDLADAAGLSCWTDPPPVVTQEPPEIWDSTNLATSDDNMTSHKTRDPLWWAPIRHAALNQEATQ